METTEVSVERTAAEITKTLVTGGARQLTMDYDGQGNVTGIQFSLQLPEGIVSFKLPARVDPVEKIMLKRRTNYMDSKARQRLREQAERVAWRQLLRWVQAQMAMVETGMVQAHEVFLPYTVHPQTKQTLFEYFSGEGLKQLTAAGS